MKSVDFVAQKVGDCAPKMKLFPKRIAKAQYNVYGNAMETMLKPFVNGVYGMMGNIVFVASQNYDPAMNVVQGLTWCDTSVQHGAKPEWQTEMRSDLCCFIILSQTAKEITLRKWRAPRKAKSESEMKEYRICAHLQTNSESVIRKGKGAVKRAHKEGIRERERRAEQPYEYQILNMVAYGSFSVKKSNFIEGSGIRDHYFDNSDRRPPMPQFPEKCHKVTKRK